MPDTIERLATCSRQLLDAGAEIERLRAECAEFKARWETELAWRKDAYQTIERLRAALFRVAGHHPATQGLSFGGDYKLLMESAVSEAIEALGLPPPHEDEEAFNAAQRAGEHHASDCGAIEQNGDTT